MTFFTQGPGQAGDQADNLVRAIHPRTQEVGDAKTGGFRRNSITSLIIVRLETFTLHWTHIFS